MNGNKEFLGVGRTWFTIYVMIGVLSAAWLMGRIEFAAWSESALYFVGLGAGKSGLQAIGAGLAAKKNGAAAPPTT